ncbi:MAG: GlsB/YeaQ/YmgE family stress response membrane protein [Chloroflexota bacterium]|nr:GlsB/YeaQ/YmgE family stress response membrane protein [Chloroflexota bacterium]
MPVFDLTIVGWIIIGFFAGALSALVVGGDRSSTGCLPNILIGILGGLVGGSLARQVFGTEAVIGWLGALVVAFIGAVIVRWLISLAR